MIDRETMRSVVEYIAAGNSMRAAERAHDISHSAMALYIKQSRTAYTPDLCFDGAAFHTHVENARAAAALRAMEPEPEPEPVEPEWSPDNSEGEAHRQELLHEAKELGIKLNPNDPMLLNPRAHLSATAGLRPQLADVERGSRAVRIDGPGRGRDEPPDDLRMVMSTRRVPFAERIHHGPLAVRDAKGNPIKQ